ncbi:nickel-dependent hydrogenase large subunit [Candidatus Woesearchaeota archaeon]|nr:nickel-dependent hydrogenase large subunit [Candidatus Woesearchaeota archaeon]
MHNHDDITIDQLSKIEGHATLDVRIRDGKVESCRLQITENKRFYTQAIRGKHYLAAPQLMSRICGTCSIAHIICCIRAIEDALGIKVSDQTEVLRILSMNGMYIRDHALHLYLFALPDVLGKDSLLDLDENKPEERRWLEEAFAVKGAGNKLSQLIAGRAVHAPYPIVGGHLRLPEKGEIPSMIEELRKMRPFVLNVIRTFHECKFDLTRKTNFVTVSGKNFLPYGHRVKASSGIKFSMKSYYEYLEQVIIPYSQAVGYVFEGTEFMLGAIARLNLNKAALERSTKKDASKFLRLFPSENVFHNNLGQAIETLHCIDQSIRLLEALEFKKEEKSEPARKSGTGFSAVEAPRGILFYKLSISEKGIIDDAIVVVPTQQNQVKMEKDIKQVVEMNIDRDRESIQHEIEKLIRAYDPCMSCASHFLKVNWN